MLFPGKNVTFILPSTVNKILTGVCVGGDGGGCVGCVGVCADMG